MGVLVEIETRLNKVLLPEMLEVLNESDLHAGHAGHKPGQVTHVRVKISAQKLQGQTRIKQHRLIHEVLDDLMSNPIHALAIEVKSMHVNSDI